MMRFFILFVMATAINKVYAHGMNSLGPNGGFIRMPANYHTELVPDKGKTSFKVFLTDISFKNPIVDNSYVKILYNNKEHVCTPIKDYFKCDINIKDNEKIIVKSMRNNIVGNEATYLFPLKLSQ